MATPKKLPSGRWRVRVFLGKDDQGRPRYKSITADTKKDAALAAARYAADVPAVPDAPRGQKSAHSATIGEVVDKYIELCSTLSPATISGYYKIRRTGFPDLWDVPVDGFDDLAAQEAINQEARREGRRGRISAKTLANEWMLISSALWHISRVKYEIRLPKRPRKFKDYPEPKAVMDAIEGTSIELPCMLALWLSFSMSEIRGLRWTDIKGDVITINRVIVDVDGKPVVKDMAKTETRNRRHRLPKYIQQLLAAADHSSQYIVPLNHDQIYGRFRTIMDKAGIDITFHDLRHLNASVMLQLNIPEKYAMERGGWKTPTVMKNVYQHTFSEARVTVDDMVDEYFENLRNMTIQHDSSGQRH